MHHSEIYQDFAPFLVVLLHPAATHLNGIFKKIRYLEPKKKPVDIKTSIVKYDTG